MKERTLTCGSHGREARRAAWVLCLEHEVDGSGGELWDERWNLLVTGGVLFFWASPTARGSSPGEGLNPHHSSDLSHSSDNAGSLTH